MKKTILTITAMAMIATGCHKKAELTSGINLDNLDTTVSPLDDFYQYACGGWLKNNPLDAEHSRYGSFDFLAEENQKQLKGIIDSVSANQNQPGSIADKIATLYNIGMDSVRLQQQGAEPLKPFLDEINAIKTRDDINAEIIKMHKRGNHVLFAVFGEADKDDAKQCIAWAYQSGLGLGDRDYYLTNEGNNAAIRDGYLKLMTTQFANAGYDQLAGVSADKLAATVMALETKLAKSQYDKLTNRDPVYEATALAGNIDWKGYFSAMGILDGIKTFNVAQPEYFAAVSDILAKEDINNLKAYFAWHEINSAASYLSDNFVNASFDFYGKLLSGREANRPRWKRVTSTVDGAMGEALGHLYVDKYFPAEAKERMKTLVDNLMTALGQRIDMATWMSDQTKANAHEKLATILVKIGYPDKWRDYSGLEIKNDSYYANIVRSNEFDMAYYMSKINKPVDRDEWQMTPQTVNAYYNPTTNEICFPAAILQPPFFQFDADDAANYGAIGVVIGHELTHGFDDQGRNYDKDGNLNDWWTEQDAENFKQNAQVLVDAFNAVKVLDDPETYANGALTLGENIADNGGLHISHLAMQNAIQKGQVNKDKMDGFTPQQRFFLAYAAVWASNIRPEAILQLTQMDVHALARNRVNVTLPHIGEFHDAWAVQQGNKMWLDPDKRAQLW